MDPLPSYNLLQAIDPTKIKVPFSERFAKLTLSSNKKQQEQFDGPEQQEELKKHLEKRDSVTRNISKLFDDGNDENKQILEQNALLRSESSTGNEFKTSIYAADMTMETLQVSNIGADNHTQAVDDLELISQQIASMVVHEVDPISLSSSPMDNITVFTDLISSESQRSSTSEVNNIHIVHNIPVNVREAAKRNTLCLNLASTINDNCEKSYEMTEDEDDDNDDDADAEAITISDTSGSHQDPEADIMATSSLPSNTLTSKNLSLPSLVEDKAERVVAFLRDVSEELRAMIKEGGQLNFYDTIDQMLEGNEIDKIQENLTKSQQIAAADTESMTLDVDEEVSLKPQLYEERRRKAYIERDSLTKKQLSEKNLNDETLDNTNITVAKEMVDTPKSLPKRKTPLKHGNTETPKNLERSIYKFASDDTQCNTEPFMSQETPKIQSEHVRNSRRIMDLETEDNTTENSFISHPNVDSGRIVNDDSLANIIVSDFENNLMQHNKSQDYKMPDGNKTKNKSSISLHSTSECSENSNQNLTSGSVINSSNEFNMTTPEEYITISETDDETMPQISPPNNEDSLDNKLSNSFQKESSSESSEYDEQMSQMQTGMANINISAKINIKISFPKFSMEISDDDENEVQDNRDGDNKGSKKSSQSPDVVDKNKPQEKYDNDKDSDSDHTVDTNNRVMEYESPQKPCNQKQIRDPVEEIASPSNKLSEDRKFLTDAEKLLNQLYGKSWQTPDIIRTLKHSCQSVDQKINKSKPFCSERKPPKKSTVEDSVLDDFTSFRKNIVKTNLDSTRLVTPTSDMQPMKDVSSEPNTKRKHSTRKVVTDAKPLPHTERKPVATNKRRINKERWRQLVDDVRGEDDNASDDDDADISWSKNASELEGTDSDLENSPLDKTRRGKSNTSKREGRSDKSDYLTRVLKKSKAGEIVYLDLSKEEVEVQDDVPESPPANHDITFASRLQDILKSCRHIDKPQLPASNKKTKRKLFTPNFGNDDLEVADPKDVEPKKTNQKHNIDDELLEDNLICPFDSLGRPKVFHPVNKQLEAVKLGRPIFQLTPPSKKKQSSSSTGKKNDKNIKTDNECTPKSKTASETKFKTPSTVKTKPSTKIVKDLMETAVYKYGFLKSLDVTVSKTFCHPDALYYRENYRMKKEDLSKILYDMYNEKLFENKLNVSIQWNKKLLNTAGRCLNKKKCGERSSVVELSDKVLTSADRLRCTLIHELCHAATWVFNGEGGHGCSWKEWARRANAIFPEIPTIRVCHQYDIEYKYTYKCTLCGATSHAHSKSKKVESIRCSYCHGAIEIFLNKKDKDGNVMPTPVKEATGFAKYVKDNYKKFKRDDLKHADVMKLLSSEFGSLKVACN